MPEMHPANLMEDPHMKTLLRLSGVSLLIAAAAVVTLPAAAHGPNCIGIPNAPGPVVISGSGCYVLVGHLAGPGPLITISSGGAVESS